jgi:predicted nucleotidyltransferase
VAEGLQTLVDALAPCARDAQSLPRSCDIGSTRVAGPPKELASTVVVMHESPRRAAVRDHATELLAVAERLRARNVGLCGSVARGDAHDDSDIDFYVWDFQNPDGIDALERAQALVKAFRGLLQPYRVDIRGIPGWMLDLAIEKNMQRDWIDLHDYEPSP